MRQISLERRRLFPGFDGITCKVNPQIMTDGQTMVMTYTKLLLTGSDVFFDNYVNISRDGGQTFGETTTLSQDGGEENGLRWHIGLSSTFYNRAKDEWLIFGIRHFYADDKVPVLRAGIAVGEAVYARFSPETGDIIRKFMPLPMPFECVMACPFGQIMEFENGDMLLSFYLATEEDTKAASMTIRYALRNGCMEMVKVGAPLTGEGHARGLCEPSVAYLNGKYYMTIRTDEVGLLAVSEDGYHFSKPEPWTWDDGEVLENYNTMQRWVRLGDALYLAYTRKNGLNDHVFRHRAPMYMTRFDEERRCLIRAEEIILVPELGARLGNFSVVKAKDEAILTTAEWMQPVGCEKYGSDNSIWMVRLGNTE